MILARLPVALFAVSLMAVSCGGGDGGDSADSPADIGAASPAEEPDETPAAGADETPAAGADETPTEAPDEAEAPAGGDEAGPGFTDEGRSLDAPEAAIVADGDASDWSDIDGLEMTLYPIGDESFPTRDSTVKVAHDGEFVYVLLQVDDDYDWSPDDPHFSGSAAIQWAVDPGAGEAMGATDADRETSLGLVDIWHWELECAAGEASGGASSGPGEGHDPGNDEACNFDDEYATTTESREDDNGDGAENSLLGVWTHTSAVADEAGTWTFEMQRPLENGDAQDAQFAVGSSSLMAIAYWDADTGSDGWEDDAHVQSSNQGWINIDFV